MLGIALFLLLLAPAFGQKKPVTLESLNESAHRRDAPGPPQWAPDGKSFVYQQRSNLVIYDPATRGSRVLIATDPMDEAAVTVPEEGPYQWQDRYVHEATLQWSPSGKELLYLSGGDLFLIHADTGKWDQLTKTPVAEHDPKISPDGKRVSFRREWDLYTLELATGHETRLTTGGSDTLRNGALDWVYPEEIGLDTAHWWSPRFASRIAYLQFDIESRTAISARGLAQDEGGVRAGAIPSSRRQQRGRPPGGRAGGGRSFEMAGGRRDEKGFHHRKSRLDARFEGRVRGAHEPCPEPA